MHILANMWDGWVSKESLIKAGKRVGVASNGLNVTWMQNDKFEQAAGIIQSNVAAVSSSPIDMICSPKHVRKNTAVYWKAKYMAAQALIEDVHEKSINLNEIPGLLTIKKITPKRNEVNTRVTQVCGSMEGKDMLKVVKSIKDQNE